ncbi:Protein DHHC-10 [Aphelenchoides avenae]|nr:Protein DHHC-10 [Aphelenchus avenae]
MCVLRKDHHCYMTGGCVGLANQRYFIVFTFWAAIGSAYAAWLNFHYLDRFFVPYYPLGWVYYIGPIGLGRWFLGYQSFFMAFLGITWSVCAMSAIGAFCFFVAEVFYTLEGYSMQDYHINRRKYNLNADGENWSERLALVFGRRWWLNFLVPQFWLPNQMTPAIARNIFLNVPKNV